MHTRTMLAAVVATCAALYGEAADQTFAYTAGTNELGNGVVTFTYDGESKITKIVSNVAKGDTVTVNGDQLDFGAGAMVETAGLGDIVIKNDIVGTDGLLVTNTSSAQLTMEWWGDDFLDTNAWTTVFENVDLDDIELVSADNKTWSNRKGGISGLSNPQMMYPFWEKRETVDGVKTMTAQLQCYNKASKPSSGFDVVVKYVGLELKQDGADIAARVTTAGYIPTNSAFSITYVNTSIYQDDMEVLRARWLADPDLDVNPRFYETPVKLPGSTGYGYGVGQLTVRRRDVPSVGLTYFGHRRFPFSTGDLKIAANARARRMGVNSYENGAGTNGVIDVEGLWESGDYVGSQGTPVKGSGTFAVVAETLGHANPCDATIKNFLTSTAVNIDSLGSIALKHSLYDLTNICKGAIMCGGSMTLNQNKNPQYCVATPHYWRFYTNGPSSYATVQMQASNSTTMIRCTILKFQQDTYDLKVSAITNLACYTPLQTGANNGEGYYGMDFENTPDDFPGFTKYKTNTSATSASPFSVSNLVCQFSREGEYSLTLNGANRNWKNGRLVVEGKPDGTRIFANINGLTRLPTNGVVEVRMGGTLNFNAGVGGPSIVSQNNSAHIKVCRGGVMRTYPDVLSSGNKWACRMDQRIDLLGGEWLPSWMHRTAVKLCYCYMNNVMFADGARVESDIPFWAGNAGSSVAGRWLVRGTSPSYIDSPVQFLGTGTTGMFKFPIDVDDVTDDSSTDFFMTKPITRYSSTSYSNIRVAKYGRGTMEIQDTIDVIHGIEIFGGAFKLAGNGLTDDSAQQFILSGGTLEAASGTVNSCGPLAITDRLGAIRLGAGATLSFADSSAETWPTERNKKVTIHGFAEGAIRFGSSKAAVPRRRMFTLPDGSPLCLKDDGYLTAILPGTTIIIR